MAVKQPPKGTRASTKRTTKAPVKTADKPSSGATLASVPDKKYFNEYISRDIVKGVSDFDLFDYARKEKQNVLIEGPTGPGKTSAVLAYAAREGMPFYAVPSNIGIEPSQLFGKFIPDHNGGFKWVDGPVTSIFRNGGVLLINEVNFMPERVATVLFGALDKRREIVLLDNEGELIKGHDDLLIIADMNPEYEGTRPLNKAFRNRFSIQVWWDYSPAVEKKLVKSDALRDMAAQLRKAHEEGEYETPCATNMLMEFEKMYADLGYEFAKLSLINHYAADERQAVDLVIETWKSKIEIDLNPNMSSGRPKGMSAKRWEELKAMLDVDRGQYINEKGQIIDPEWGTHGIKWLYEEDDEADYPDFEGDEEEVDLDDWDDEDEN